MYRYVVEAMLTFSPVSSRSSNVYVCVCVCVCACAWCVRVRV